MKKIIITIMFFINTGIVLGKELNMNFVSQANKIEIMKEYGREMLSKHGLHFCLFIDDSLNNKTKKIITTNSVYYVQRMIHTTSTASENDFNLDIDVLKPYFKKKLSDEQKKDEVGIDKCLSIYSSDEYKKMIKEYDGYISTYEPRYESIIREITFHFPNIFYYEPLKRKNKLLGDWGFYQCLSKGIPDDKDIKIRSLKLLKKIEESGYYNENNLNNIKYYYDRIRKQYASAQNFQSLGCFIAYDSPFLNNMINSFSK